MWKAIWHWLTHERCAQCFKLAVPRTGVLGGRRVCIYCPDCGPEFYERRP